MFIILDTKEVVSQGELRRRNPNTSLPAQWDQSTFDLLGVAPVFPAPQPTFDPITQMAREIAPVLTDKGHWEQRWEVIARFQEYTDEEGVVHTVAEQEAAAIAADAAAKKDALEKSIVDAVQARLDDFARTRNYDGILSAATYATSTVPKFQAEGQYAVETRDATWAKLYEILAEVEAGTRPAPSGFEDIEPELPALAWPV